MHQLWIETIVCNFVKPVGLYLYSHICLHAVGSMAPKCTSVVTLTVNSCGWDHTNYPRHATNHSLARWYLNCKDISLNMHDVCCKCAFDISLPAIGWYGLSLTGCILHSTIYMHSHIPTCEAGTLMMHLDMHVDWYLSVFVWWRRWWRCHDNTNDPKHSLSNQLCRFTLLYSGPGNGQSVHMWWFTLSWGQCRATPKHMFASHNWWSPSSKGERLLKSK